MRGGKCKRLKRNLEGDENNQKKGWAQHIYDDEDEFEELKVLVAPQAQEFFTCRKQVYRQVWPRLYSYKLFAAYARYLSHSELFEGPTENDHWFPALLALLSAFHLAQ